MTLFLLTTYFLQFHLTFRSVTIIKLSHKFIFTSLVNGNSSCTYASIDIIGIASRDGSHFCLNLTASGVTDNTKDSRARTV